MLSKWATSNSCWADNEIDRPKEDTRPFKVKTTTKWVEKQSGQERAQAEKTNMGPIACAWDPSNDSSAICSPRDCHTRF